MQNLIWILNKARLKLIKIIYTLRLYLVAFLSGIKIGSNCKSYGLVILSIYPKSTINIGDNCRFRSDPRSNYVGMYKKANSIATLNGSAKINIGNSCGFSGVAISSQTNINIGNNVLCGANVIITDTDWHPFGNSTEATSKPISIGNKVWIGANSIILKGVKIGDNSIVGAGSIVLKSIPDNEIWAGNPAKYIKKIT